MGNVKCITTFFECKANVKSIDRMPLLFGEANRFNIFNSQGFFIFVVYKLRYWEIIYITIISSLKNFYLVVQQVCTMESPRKRGLFFVYSWGVCFPLPIWAFPFFNKFKDQIK